MPLPKRFKEKLMKALREEESDLYVLAMHYRNDGDLNYFNSLDRRRVKTILDVLIRDMKSHSDMLKAMTGQDAS